MSWIYSSALQRQVLLNTSTYKDPGCRQRQEGADGEREPGWYLSHASLLVHSANCPCFVRKTISPATRSRAQMPYREWEELFQEPACICRRQTRSGTNSNLPPFP